MGTKVRSSCCLALILMAMMASATVGNPLDGASTFDTPETTADLCSQQPAEIPMGVGGKSSAPRTCYYYSTDQSDCVGFQAVSCGGIENSFVTKDDCAETCMKTRNTRRIPQDISYKMLSDFEWAAPGIGTNVIRRRFPIAFCDLERDMGILCNGIRRGSYLEQFFYDARTNRCNSFIYNGCGGNANRFSSIWECTQSCVRKTMQHF